MSAPKKNKSPVVTLVVGMAGSGKTSVTSRLRLACEAIGLNPYVLNLDPAVRNLPYEPNVDIRDTIDYVGIRKKYNLGPNGAILTACNLFATRFDQVISLCHQRRNQLDYVFVDTPGQIEIFTWSASGAIVCESFQAEFPTVLLYILDTPRVHDAQVFLSNMLQCLSIVYKTKLAVVLVYNKVDVLEAGFAAQWMKDSSLIHSVLESGTASYSSELAKSVASTISEFYADLKYVGVSALKDEGFAQLLDDLAEVSQGSSGIKRDKP
jgi:GPN-loop GTPase